MKIKIEKPDQVTLAAQRVKEWPVWECGVSEFDWHYDQEEVCYILEGEASVKTAWEEVKIGPGDFVTFPRGLDCRWQVCQPVRKHYSFS